MIVFDHTVLFDGCENGEGTASPKQMARSFAGRSAYKNDSRFDRKEAVYAH